jgi:hypothetical protein
MICPSLHLADALKGDTHSKRSNPPRFLKELHLSHLLQPITAAEKVRPRQEALPFWNTAQRQFSEEPEQGRAPETGANLSTSLKNVKN